VKKGSGTAQAELMKWLTDYKRNGHFDTDVQGAGDKFFVSETGKLYAVLSPQMSLFGRAMTAIVNQPGGN
jgi:hypothetical protein